MIKRYIKMVRHYWWALGLGTAGLVGAALMNLVAPALVRNLTASLTDGTLTKNTLLVMAAILLGSYLLRAVFRYLAMYYTHVAAWNFVGELTAMVYAKLQKLSMKFYADKQTGQLMSRVINDTRLLEVLMAHALPDLASNLLMLVGVTVMIFFIHPVLALITLLPVPLVLYVGTFFSKKVAPLFRINQRVLGELSGTLQDHLAGMKEIQAFGMEGAEDAAMTEFSKQYSAVNIYANKANAIFHPSIELLTSLGTLAVIGFGGVAALNGKLTTADIVGFFMYLGLFYQPLTMLSRTVEDVQSAMAGGERVLEILDAPEDITDAPDAAPLTDVTGALTFENVSFHYNPEEPVLADVSFHAAPGQMIALVGATGVGKTTMASLVERFYDPVSGRILLDGIDIKTASVGSLRQNLSLVLQDVFLFNGTIADNIAFGCRDAARSQIKDAAVIACAHDFIASLPNGYDTLISERGMRLSGGQKQRIAIARAVLRQTPVLILDEATSAVDTETESAIQQAIENLAGRRTMLVIAHRLSTIRRADMILVLENGRIAERGTHSELLSKNGVYARLCAVQANNFMV
ncbi:MAG TPA: ABC transporter ATP-binding protein [Oscillospiraceae bacterium]|nr:ABC transporter ATP-binding protein [Oscillospiraceae bacterium]HPS34309.1 ABC transporter ATP-binding protein [Oscillospiraceae bacterium]